MKNLSSFKLLFIFLIVLLSFGAKAVLPPLGPPPPNPVTLPYVFNSTNYFGTINMDGNSSEDFFVYFMYTSTGGGQYHSYCQISGISSGNEILTEFEGIFGSPTSSSQTKPPLSDIPGTPFTKILSNGEIIGPLLESTSGLTFDPSGTPYWFPSPYIFEYTSGSLHEPLGSNFTDDVFAGYLGVHYLGDGGNWYYGWLNVEIDPLGMWVKINSSGHASAEDTPVPAGLNDPFAVPIPIIASILGFGLIGGGIYLKRRKEK
jgi:hypothetical protein